MMVWRRPLRALTLFLYWLANIFLIAFIVLWFASEVYELDWRGLEPITVFISSMISYLAAGLSRLAERRFASRENRGHELHGPSGIVADRAHVEQLNVYYGQADENSREQEIQREELRPLLRRGQSANLSIQEALEHLREWKTFHEAVQDLLLSVIVFDAELNRLTANPETRGINEKEDINATIEHVWYTYCDGNSKALKRFLSNVNQISIPFDGELTLYLEGEQSIYEQINGLSWQEWRRHVSGIKRTSIRLRTSLSDSLRLADKWILDLATTLQERNIDVFDD